MSNLFASQELPRRRTGSALAWLDRHGIGLIALTGGLLYLFVVLFVSLIEFVFHTAGHDLVLNDKGAGVGNFLDLYCIRIESNEATRISIE